MMEMFLDSTKVIVFPLAKERVKGVDNDGFYNSRLLTEYNVSNIIRQIMGDKIGFIISVENNTDSTFTKVKFNLDGYYFEIDYPYGDNVTDGNLYSVYANLVKDSTNQELCQDVTDGDDNLFTGLNISTIDTNNPDNVPEKSIHLFDFRFVDGSVTTTVSPNSYFSFSIGGIDGKPRTNT